VACLADGPRAVGQLAAGLPVSRPAVSQHLKILKDAGEAITGGVDGPQGWPLYLDRYAALVKDGR
jgi:predicted ArsR family transcriptional regulator